MWAQLAAPAAAHGLLYFFLPPPPIPFPSLPIPSRSGGESVPQLPLQPGETRIQDLHPLTSCSGAEFLINDYTHNIPLIDGTRTWMKMKGTPNEPPPPSPTRITMP